MADHEVAAGGGEGNVRGAVVWAQLGGISVGVGSERPASVPRGGSAGAVGGVGVLSLKRLSALRKIFVVFNGIPKTVRSLVASVEYPGGLGTSSG